MSEHWEEMAADVRRRAPHEACGLLAGDGGLSRRVFPIPNELNSQVRFRMEPGEQLRAMLAIEEAGEELLAIYHSHPGGPAWPSPSDVAEAAYPGVIYLIWYRQAGDWECGGFLIEGDRVLPAVIHRRTAPADR